MKNRKHVQIVIAGALAAHLTLFGAALPIGMVIQYGDFKLDAVKVQSNATLFEGNSLETEKGLARLYLRSGATIQLASESKARIFADRLVLESGSTVFSGSPYRVEALSLQIQTESAAASARVRLARPGAVRVDAVQGSVTVRNAQGLLLARVAQGTAVDLDPTAQGPSTMQVTGILRWVNGHFLLEDPVAGVTVELRGSNLERALGKRVRVSGTPLPEKSEAGAAHVIDVISIDMLPGTAGKKAAGAAPAGGATGGVLGMSSATAVVLGVGVAAAVAVTGVALARDGESGDAIPSSR